VRQTDGQTGWSALHNADSYKRSRTTSEVNTSRRSRRCSAASEWYYTAYSTIGLKRLNCLLSDESVYMFACHRFITDMLLGLVVVIWQSAPFMEQSGLWFTSAHSPRVSGSRLPDFRQWGPRSPY